MSNVGSYRTLKKASESEVYKVKGSKFLSFAFPVQDREEIEEILAELRSGHHKANHCCYAWKLGTDPPEYRFNDDGEPTNSAGKPIYGQILSLDLTNVLVAVVRYFGGTKLGVGGLIHAYRESARLGLEGAGVVEREIKGVFTLKFQYASMDKVMRLVREKQLEVTSQDMGLDVSMTLLVSRRNEAAFRDQLSQWQDVKLLE
jgi:uncharacterized YigZ family protein